MAQRTSEAVPAALQGIDKPSSKAKARNSRTGCGECKTKRLKCDENRPACKQCTRRGRLCPGYQRQYRWSTVHEKLQQVDRTPPFWPQTEHAALLNTLTHGSSPENWPFGASLHGHNVDVAVPRVAHLHSGEVHKPAFLPGTRDLSTVDNSHGNRIDQDSITAIWNADAASDLGQSTPWELYTGLDESLDPTGTQADSTLFINPSASSTCRPGDHPGYKPIEHVTTSTPSIAPTTPQLLYTPIHLPTMLIEYWFTDVCPMWSAFDSQTNPNRLLAVNSWQHSDAVFYALQSMSAACLAETLPHVTKTIPVLFSQAIEAIQRGTQARKAQYNGTPGTLPKDLLLAIMAMGTSVCWTDTRQLGIWFLGKAHELLDLVEDGKFGLEESERGELSYFRAALVYWEMLYRAIGWDPQNTLKNKRAMYKERLRKAMSWPGEPSIAPRDTEQPAIGPIRLQKFGHDATIHPWTGVSAEVQHTFGLVILMCRDRQRADRKQGARTAAALSDALCDIELARSFARELVNADFYQQAQEDAAFASSYDTGDSTTPVSHLIDTAEAYRLASLLLLCQTFPDLEVDGALSLATSVSGTAESSQGHALLMLTMRLVETLRRIPAKSGTRCIQPLLYICAGSGLKFDTTEGLSRCLPSDNQHGRRPTNTEDDSPTVNAARLGVAQISPPGGLYEAARLTADSTLLTTCTLEVSRARRFVVDRLCALQRTLPPKPIGVALDLVKAIWAEYDEEEPKLTQLHWIDIMVDKGLQTLFG